MDESSATARAMALLAGAGQERCETTIDACWAPTTSVYGGNADDLSELLVSDMDVVCGRGKLAFHHGTCLL